MTTVAGAPVVVGVDGSAVSLAAVDLAAREAQLRNRPLRVVHAFIWPYLNVPLGPSLYGPPEGGLRHDTERIVADAVERAGSAFPDVTVTGKVVTGAPGTVLVDESCNAALVVIGDRGLGGFTGLLVGSVAVQLAAHAACPLIVVRGEPGRTGDVLVGIDGSPASDNAVGFAFEEAAYRGVPLTAMHTWTEPAVDDYLPAVHSADRLEAEEARVFIEALAGWRDKYPDVTVHRRIIRGHAGQVLVEASSRAQLLVVGCRGRGGFAGLLLGSVSQAVLHHAACPVAVIRHGAR
jgi:nucleotide-binding universal stress UspA family protein